MAYTRFPWRTRDGRCTRRTRSTLPSQGAGYSFRERIVLRVSADLFDAYSAQESITRALEYSAGVMKHFLTQMEACAKQSGVFQTLRIQTSTENPEKERRNAPA